ncbi:hypothetical protein [Caulobacter sp. 17J80-11]|uniref:hypothetical protein n=1 Tax=Caulobacter sp. 17J80-11 TaxID=2763502 RepID=UPI001653479C|nr:hypothetical protein [Caulobacter sp. 17J80-11]MBC6981958.1 hypothetical protein [Caulobacter sp. 17J80-11]
MKARVFGLLAALTVGVSGAAGQALPVSASPSAEAPSLGKVMTGPSSSVFAISSSGAVTRTSGTAVRITNTGTSVPTVTVTCNIQSGNTCSTGTVRIVVTAASTSRASITSFTASGLKCDGATCQSITGTTGPAPSLDFSVRAPGKQKAVTFTLPMEVTIAATPTTGNAVYRYNVSASVN